MNTNYQLICWINETCIPELSPPTRIAPAISLLLQASLIMFWKFDILSSSLIRWNAAQESRRPRKQILQTKIGRCNEQKIAHSGYKRRENRCLDILYTTICRLIGTRYLGVAAFLHKQPRVETSRPRNQTRMIPKRVSPNLLIWLRHREREKPWHHLLDLEYSPSRDNHSSRAILRNFRNNVSKTNPSDRQ